MLSCILIPRGKKLFLIFLLGLISASVFASPVSSKKSDNVLLIEDIWIQPALDLDPGDPSPKIEFMKKTFYMVFLLSQILSTVQYLNPFTLN